MSWGDEEWEESSVHEQEDNPEEMVERRPFATLPPELLSLIAVGLDSKDQLRFQRSNREISTSLKDLPLATFEMCENETERFTPELCLTSKTCIPVCMYENCDKVLAFLDNFPINSPVLIEPFQSSQRDLKMAGQTESYLSLVMQVDLPPQVSSIPIANRRDGGISSFSKRFYLRYPDEKAQYPYETKSSLCRLIQAVRKAKANARVQFEVGLKLPNLSSTVASRWRALGETQVDLYFPQQQVLFPGWSVKFPRWNAPVGHPWLQKTVMI